jgi:hypothetical protein
MLIVYLNSLLSINGSSFINPSTIQFLKNFKKSYRRSPRRQGTDTAVGHGVTPAPC